MPQHAINGTDIYYEDHGNGPAVLLGHSFLCSGAMWAPQVAALARDYRVINMDLRGHGRSGPAHRPFTIDDMVGDAVGLLEHLGLDQAVWAGLSIGGMIALNAALAHPDRVRGLILVDTTADAESVASRIKYSVMSAGVGLIGPRPFLPTILKLMFGETSRRSKPDLVAAWRDRFANVDVPSMRQCIAALNRRPDILGRLSQITAPATVIVGAEDSALPPIHSERIARALPAAALVTIANAGHLSSLEQPEAVTEAMADFLKPLA